MRKVVRLATPLDIRALVRIRHDAVTYKLSHADRAWGEKGWHEATALANVKMGHTHLVEVDGVAAAMMMLVWEDKKYWGEQPPKAGYLHGLAVEHNFRGLGLGAFVIHWAKDQIIRQRRQYLRLDCDAGNLKLCACYESLGFRRVATKDMPELGAYVASLYESAVHTTDNI